jgi:hypothetical protein
MKKNVLVFVLLLVLLSGCEKEKIVVDYSVFSNKVSTYETSEMIDEELYAVYYYDSSDQNSNNLYELFLEAYNLFDTFKLYVLDTAELEGDASTFGAYAGEPIIYFVRNNIVEETYKGVDGVNAFFVKYLRLDYNLFEERKVDTLSKSLVVSDDIHIEYYYSVNCGHCQLVKPDLLYMFLLHEDLEFYLFDLGELGWGVTIDGFEGTPTLYVIENNEVISSYVGSENVKSFIEGYSQGFITVE